MPRAAGTDARFSGNYQPTSSCDRRIPVTLRGEPGGAGQGKSKLRVQPSSVRW